MPTYAKLDMDKMHYIMGVYNSIMEEIKYRLLTINEISRKELDVSEVAKSEFYILQLRKVCELIALGCLLAHGDMEKTKTAALQKQWDPTLILKELERLHPSFYPTPHNPSSTDETVFLDDIKEEYLTKKDLITLYGKCGDALHRGSLKRLLGKSNEGSLDILDYVKKIERLLRTHKISSLNNKIHIICSINYIPNGGKSFCALAQSPE